MTNKLSSKWDVIRLIEEELKNRRKVNKLKHQLNRLKNLAHTIEHMINTGESDYDVHKATNIFL